MFFLKVLILFLNFFLKISNNIHTAHSSACYGYSLSKHDAEPCSSCVHNAAITLPSNPKWSNRFNGRRKKKKKPPSHNKLFSMKYLN